MLKCVDKLFLDLKYLINMKRRSVE